MPWNVFFESGGLFVNTMLDKPLTLEDKTADDGSKTFKGKFESLKASNVVSQVMHLNIWKQNIALLH